MRTDNKGFYARCERRVSNAFFLPVYIIRLSLEIPHSLFCLSFLLFLPAFACNCCFSFLFLNVWLCAMGFCVMDGGFRVDGMEWGGGEINF